tara:strand:+ start:99 stop:287 length:189 start_codon:yes stop_codon:yes gene_type:complete
MAKKKEVKAVKEKVKESTVGKYNIVKESHINEIWEIIKEIQENLTYLNDKIKRILDRMGLDG